MVDDPHVLVVTTSHSRIDDEHATGLWLEEFAVPYERFRSEGFEVTVASPQGGRVPIDPRSEPEGEPSPAEADALDVLSDTRRLEEVDPARFDAVFFPGGHGTMFDLATQEVGDLVIAFAEASKPIAAVCHGPAAFVSARYEEGTPYVQGRRLTCFTDEEERKVELDDAMPFLLESKLRELGGQVDTQAAFSEHVVEDDDLITGQNPPSSGATAKALIARLAEEATR